MALQNKNTFQKSGTCRKPKNLEVRQDYNLYYYYHYFSLIWSDENNMTLEHAPPVYVILWRQITRPRRQMKTSESRCRAPCIHFLSCTISPAKEGLSGWPYGKLCRVNPKVIKREAWWTLQRGGGDNTHRHRQERRCSRPPLWPGGALFVVSWSGEAQTTEQMRSAITGWRWAACKLSGTTRLLADPRQLVWMLIQYCWKFCHQRKTWEKVSCTVLRKAISEE